MQKNWYIIYTKSGWEKKVASSLKKRKIENFLPLHFKCVESFRKIRRIEEPLFERYVFANVEEHNVLALRNIGGVINLAFWKGQPATINKEEIDIINAFIRNYENIRVEKIKVGATNRGNQTDGSIYSLYGNLLSIKKTVSKVTIPSIGFTLVAKVGLTDEEAKTKSVFVKTDLLIQS